MTLVSFCFVMAMSAQSLFVGSYNIRNKNDGDSIKGNVWSKRSQVMCDQINFMQPDLFGTQEMFYGQITDFLRMLPDYSYIGVAREDGKKNGEHSAIFYRKDKFELLDHGDFWLSETPDKPGLGWDAACVRICTWGEFRDKCTKFRFFYFNLHMDHVGIVARREAAKLVVKRIKEQVGVDQPVILTGDFNVDQTNEIYNIFTESGVLKDTYEHAKYRFAENGTFNSFNSSLKSDSRIDHIFVSPKFQVNTYGVLTDGYWTESTAPQKKQKGKDAPQELDFKKFDKRTPSDHYPVMSRIVFCN